MKPINELTPDELRIEIAARLGWYKRDCESSAIPGYVRRDEWYHPDHGYDNLPNWPGDNSAYDLAEKMRGMGYSVSIEMLQGMDAPCSDICRAIKSGKMVYQFAETSRIAVCRCFLEVMEQALGGRAEFYDGVKE